MMSFDRKTTGEEYVFGVGQPMEGGTGGDIPLSVLKQVKRTEWLVRCGEPSRLRTEMRWTIYPVDLSGSAALADREMNSRSL